MRTRTVIALFGTASALVLVAPSRPGSAATITASYAAGHHNVTINDYGTPALGTFVLADGGQQMVALCVEADQHHTKAHEAYAPVPNRIESAELDALLWLLGDGSELDADTAMAAAALAWFYGNAYRDFGVPVWADGARGFQRITPLAPEPWDGLRRFGASHPVGLRSGSTDLDGAERRVAELHRTATALAGPWSLTSDPAGRRVRLEGRAGALAGRVVSFTIATGSDVTTVTATTDAEGWATPPMPPLPDGATVTAWVAAPGVHREWDGAPGIQRMVTATATTLTADFDLPALPRFVVVHKASSDPSIAVAGAELALIDAHSATAATATTDTDGKAVFAPVDPSVHPAPYLVREVHAPPGLLAADDVTVAVASHDPAQPTVVEIVDHPARAPVRVRKQFSEPVEQTDRSGFVFALRRDTAGFEDELVTGPDGTTDTVLVPLGDYQVCETAAPTWAADFADGGCITFAIGLEQLAASEPLTFEYLNVVPTTTTTTTSTTTTTVAATTPPAPTAPPPSSVTIPHPPETTTTTSSTVANLPPDTSMPRSLPRTGNGGARVLLRLADFGFLVGVALVAVAGLQRKSTTAGPQPRRCDE